MNVLVVSGIWPPDVGGPASHGPDVASYLQQHGHDVRVVVAADRAPAPQPYPIRWASRSLPKGVVHARAAALIAQEARRADVVYTTGMFGRTALACIATRTPYVVKLTGDPAFERARWRGSVEGDVEAFQAGRGHRALRALRNLTVRRAAHVICPSGFLAEHARAWGARAVTVLPNPAPDTSAVRPRPRHAEGIVLAFAGRIGAQKALDVLLAAVARVPDVSLLIAGEGELPAAERVHRLGALPREEVLALFAGVDASVLSSAWENFPHTVVESLAVGTPVIATRVGGVPEVVEDGVNGLLVEPGDPAALAAAIERFAHDAGLRERLRANARRSVERYSEPAVYGELERILTAAAR